MRKLFITAMFLLMLPLSVSAANGDIVGHIYSTDIETVVNGRVAEGYNIGGKTAVIIEDLYNKGYGVSYRYNDETRTLEAWMDFEKNFTYKDVNIPRGNVGKILGNVYDTDIKVIFNGSEVKGYNIGGKTAVCIEDIGTITENPNSQYGYSEYLCNFKWDNDERRVSLNSIGGYIISNVGGQTKTLDAHCYKLTLTENIIHALYDPMYDYNVSMSGTEPNLSDTAAPYEIKPLYLEVDGENYLIGLCYSHGGDYTRYFVDDLDETAHILQKLKTDNVTAEEALKTLNDGMNYKTLDNLETEDFYFVVVEDLKVNGDRNDVIYFAVKKTGGYAKISSSATHYTKRTLEKVGINTVDVTISPFAGPHGATSLRERFDLNSVQP